MPAMGPAAGSNLSAGTELNVVVNLSCLRNAAHGNPRLPWLNNLAASLQHLRVSGLRSYVWRLEKDTDFFELQRAFERESCVHLVSPNNTFFMHAAFNDPMIPNQEHLKSLRFADALNDLYIPLLVRKKVVIAVIDSGVDFTHPDLQASRWFNRDEVGGNNRDDDRNGYVDDVHGFNFAIEKGDVGPQGDLPEAKHGTHVAGLAASRADNGVGGVGVNGVARIMALNIFGPNNTTRSALLENAIRYAADNGADVINLSLGGREYSRTMRAALDYAIAKGSFIVTASGNYGLELCDNPDSFGFISPAVYSSTISGMMVTGSVDAGSGRLSVFSNYSKRLMEITAPGAYLSEAKLGLLSTIPGDTYAYLAGTSMSAPVLSGAASLVFTWLRTYRYPVSPQKVETILRAAAKKDPSLADWVQEGRTLDLPLLVEHLKTNYPPR
jgi:subtilisin family serine protease